MQNRFVLIPEQRANSSESTIIRMPGRKINYIAQGTDFTIYVSAELTEVAWQRKMFIPQTDVWDLSIDKSR